MPALLHPCSPNESNLVTRRSPQLQSPHSVHISSSREMDAIIGARAHASSKSADSNQVNNLLLCSFTGPVLTALRDPPFKLLRYCSSACLNARDQVLRCDGNRGFDHRRRRCVHYYSRPESCSEWNDERESWSRQDHSESHDCLNGEMPRPGWLA